MVALLFVSHFSPAFSQVNNSFCATYIAVPPDGSNPDSLLYDRFGNAYDLEDLLVPGAPANLLGGGCNSGYFNLTWVGNPPQQIQNLVCQVFGYISTVIEQRQSETNCNQIPPQPVNIQVGWLNFAAPDPAVQTELDLDPAMPLPPNGAGIGTPFYTGLFNFQCKEVALDRPFIKINGGIPNPVAGFDGRMLLNSAMNWNLDATATTFNNIDLYTVTLHEAMHMLGFASRMSFVDVYSLWDQTLRTATQYTPGGGGTGIMPIVTNLSGGVSNCWGHNQAQLGNLAVNSCDNLAGPAVVVGDAAIAPIAGNPGVVPVPVTGAEINAFNNMLSHLSGDCAGQNIPYVMLPGIAPGEFRRVITAPEQDIFCALGYRLQGGECDGCFNITHEEGSVVEPALECCFQMFYGCANEPLEILNADLLCNDISNSKTQTVTRIWEPNNQVDIQPNQDENGWIITFLPAFTGSFITLRYTVAGCDGRMHDNNIFIRVEQQCQPCEPPADPCENLLCFDDFENFTNVNGMETWLGHPFLIDGNDRLGSPDIRVVNGNHCLFMGGGPTFVAFEPVSMELQECIPPGCSLSLAMDLASLNSATNTVLQIWGSQIAPCPATNAPFTPIANNCNTPTICAPGIEYQPVCIANLPVPNTIVNDNDFEFDVNNEVAFIWPNTSDEEVCFLTFVPAGGSTNLDNISAIRTCQPTITCEADMLGDICPEGKGQIVFRVCAEGLPEGQSTTITPALTLPAGWTLLSDAPEPFTLAQGACEQITILVQAPADALPTNQYPIVLSGTATDFCAQTSTEWSGQGNFLVIDCDPPVSFACGCPPGANNYNIGAPNTTTLLSDSGLPLNTIISNACIAIHGELLIDDGTTTPISLATENCEFRMQPGASIRVGSKNTFNARLGSIRGCTEESMWRSIFTEDRSILQLRGVAIEDAQRAVVLSHKSEITLASNHFARNYISVYSPPAPASPIPGIIFTCIANEFDCDNQTLHPAFDNQEIVFQPGAASWAGMFLNDIVTPINVGSFQTGNTFRHMANGIVLNNVPMGVYNATFSDIRRSTLHPNTLVMGNGVSAVGNGQPLIVQGVPPVPGDLPADPNFQRCDMGVSTRGIPATITNNRMQQMGSGIRMDTPGEASLIAHDNWIGCDNIGIHAYQCAEANVLSIRRNEVHVDQNASDDLSRGTAIQLNDQGLSHQLCTVEDNQVWLYGRNLGISLNGSRTVRVSENNLHLQNSSLNIAGIDLRNAGDNDVRCNNVTGAGQNQGSANIALRINNCDDTQYADNQFDHTRIGTQLENMCSGTWLRANTYDAHQKGILLKSTLLGVDNQEHAGNRFLNINAPARGAEREFGPATRFFVHTTAAPFWPPNPLPSSGFVVQDPGNNPWTPGPDFCQLSPDPLDGKTETDIKVAKGELEGPGALPWLAEKQLYRKLRLHPGLLQEAEELEEFKQLYEYGALGRLDAAEEKTGAMIQPAASLSAAIAEREEQVNAHIAYLQKLESNLLVAPDYEGLDDLALQKAAISPVGDSLLLLLLDARTEVADYRAPLLAQAVAENNLASGTDVWIANEKTVNAIYLQTAAQGLPVSAAQQTTLAAIAVQCPTDGGDAVFKARSLYAGIDWTTFFEVADACGGSSFQQGSEERNIDAENAGMPYMVQIIPNPASDQFQVLLSVPEGFDGFVIMSDLSGKIIQKVQISASETIQFIPSAGLSGMFLCHLLDSEGKVLDRKKVVILK
ncbi:MAG: hypothetical protein JNM22_10950 [Saprospiraceae bacterium]|nr:hypothetical protein [Saprospiraceae bacterium]